MIFKTTLSIFDRQFVTETGLKVTLTYIIIALVVLFSYLAFPSQQHHWDGAVQDAARVTVGQVDTVSRHFLYTLLGVPYFKIWRWFGYPGDATWPLQVLNACLGAAGVVLLGLTLQRITDDLLISTFVALGFGFSYGYWYFLEDTWYNVLGIALLILASWILFQKYSGNEKNLSPFPQLRSLISLSFVVALAILASQEHLISAIAIGAAIFILTGGTFRKKIGFLGIFAVLLVLITGTSYLLFGWFAAEVQSFAEFPDWLASYATVQTNRYMSFDIRHFTAGSRSFLATFIPLDRGLGLRNLFSGILRPNKILPQISLLTIFLVDLSVIIGLIKYRMQIWQDHKREFLIAGIWFSLCAVFTIWSDPYGPERWIIATVPLAIMVAIVFSHYRSASVNVFPHTSYVFGTIAVTLIFLGNLTGAIGPDHYLKNPLLEQAKCSRQYLTSSDVILSTGWDFSRYLDIVSPDVEVVVIAHLSVAEIGRTPDRDRLIDIIDKLIVDTNRNGGRTYLVDVFEFDEDGWQVVEWSTGLTEEDFKRYPRRLAWACSGTRVWKIESPDR